jgi:hypothetical protein
VGSAVVIAQIEKPLFWDALYFSFITGLTICYGDIVVKTPFGRLVAVLLGLIGIKLGSDQGRTPNIKLGSDQGRTPPTKA